MAELATAASVALGATRVRYAASAIYSTRSCPGFVGRICRMFKHAQRKTQTVAAGLQKSYMPGFLFLIRRSATEFSLAQRKRGSKFLVGIKRRERSERDVFTDAGALEFLCYRAPRILAGALAHYGIGVACIG